MSEEGRTGPTGLSLGAEEVLTSPPDALTVNSDAIQLMSHAAAIANYMKLSVYPDGAVTDSQRALLIATLAAMGRLVDRLPAKA